MWFKDLELGFYEQTMISYFSNELLIVLLILYCPIIAYLHFLFKKEPFSNYVGKISPIAIFNRMPLRIILLIWIILSSIPHMMLLGDQHDSRALSGNLIIILIFVMANIYLACETVALFKISKLYKEENRYESLFGIRWIAIFIYAILAVALIIFLSPYIRNYYIYKVIEPWEENQMQMQEHAEEVLNNIESYDFDERLFDLPKKPK